MVHRYMHVRVHLYIYHHTISSWHLHLYQSVHWVLPMAYGLPLLACNTILPTLTQHSWLYHNSAIRIYRIWIFYLSVCAFLHTHHHSMVVSFCMSFYNGSISPLISEHIYISCTDILYQIWIFTLCPLGNVAQDTHFNWYYTFYCVRISCTCSKSASGTRISSSGPYPFHLSKY